MAQTFDIRFAKAHGIAALFDDARNSFGWKGHGRISIDAHGMDVALKRGLASWLTSPRVQRIPGESIQEVYREGAALRVEFASGDNPRATLPFWVRDADTAARIVQLLPTTRTVEIEHSADDARSPSVPRRTPLGWGVALVLIAASAALWVRYQRPEPVVARATDVTPVLELPPDLEARPTIEAPLPPTGGATDSTASAAAPIETSLATESAAPAAA
ncbi:MAG TPA: hypothetical protein VFZ95_01155, partial [Steroidobacteraceae bacterium]